MNRAGKHFLPFTPAGKRTELSAIGVKKRLGVAAAEPVDPFEVLTSVPARLLDPSELERTAPAVAAELYGSSSDEWSAIGFGESPITRESLILLNPTHHRHRQRVSLMEEVVHIVLGHPKTALQLNGKLGGWTRPYDDKIEDEAYSVGAACVIPFPPLFTAIYREHRSRVEIAAQYDVSDDYVRFRINRAGLARVYAKHARMRPRRPAKASV